MIRVTPDGQCSRCGHPIGRVTTLTSGRLALEVNARWRRTDSADPLASRTWVKTDHRDRDLLPGLEAGLYGSSFRFSVSGEDRVERPARSEHNPDRWPERTVTEAHVYEFGAVVFPAYAGATAGVRSLTDWYVNWTPARRERALVLLRARWRKLQ